MQYTLREVKILIGCTRAERKIIPTHRAERNIIPTRASSNSKKGRKEK
jgi:hypothetical protein